MSNDINIGLVVSLYVCIVIIYCVNHVVYGLCIMSKYDEILLGVLKEQGHLLPFLDTVFGFLYRCTDFYRIQEDPSGIMGFPPGVANNLVTKVMKKWETQARQDDDYYYKKRTGSDDDVPSAIQEIEVPSDDREESTKKDPEDKKVAQENSVSEKEVETKDVSHKAQGDDCSPQNCISSKNDSKKKVSSSDCYNGAVRDNYRWSQTIIDVDVQVPVPDYIAKARDVRVSVTTTSVSVAVKDKDSGKWTTLVEGELSCKNNKEESIWSLEAGRHIQIHLEKSQERWWDSLLVSEPKIDLSSIDATRSMDDLAQDEQMKIHELMWNREQKRQGLPTSDQLAAENILKEAWNKEGSPFLGTNYDPTLINFGNSCSEFE